MWRTLLKTIGRVDVNLVEGCELGAALPNSTSKRREGAMRVIVTAVALRKADSMLGLLFELLVESLEASLPPLKAYLAIGGLGDLGPLVPVE